MPRFYARRRLSVAAAATERAKSATFAIGKIGEFFVGAGVGHARIMEFVAADF